MDADIHGPSLPKMIGLNDKPKTDGKSLFPLEKYGAQFMSLGFLVDEKLNDMERPNGYKCYQNFN